MTERMSRLVRAGLLTGVTDGLFATVQSLVTPGSTVLRLWQGVASTVLGKSAYDGGVSTALVGLLMHFCVAFGWSAVFLFVVMRSSWVRRTVSSTSGVVRVAALYGPFIWLFMSLIVIPVLLHRPPKITSRWGIQLVGHIPFVGLPIVASIAGAATMGFHLGSARRSSPV
jgi:uncharacterized membrane protein YagU involved in acid resistance